MRARARAITTSARCESKPAFTATTVTPSASRYTRASSFCRSTCSRTVNRPPSEGEGKRPVLTGSPLNLSWGMCYHPVPTISPILQVRKRWPSPSFTSMWRRLSHFLGVVDLAGAAEVADMLGVSTQQVDRLARQPDFPKPVAVLKAGRIWRRRDIERWMTTGRRSRGRPEKPYPPRR